METARIVGEMIGEKPLVLTREFAEHVGISTQLAHNRLKQAEKSGELVKVGKGYFSGFRPAGSHDAPTHLPGSPEELIGAVAELQDGEGAKAGDVADVLGVKTRSLASRFQYAKQRGFLKTNGRGGVRCRWKLTAKGKRYLTSKTN